MKMIIHGVSFKQSQCVIVDNSSRPNELYHVTVREGKRVSASRQYETNYDVI